MRLLRTANPARLLRGNLRFVPSYGILRLPHGIGTRNRGHSSGWAGTRGENVEKSNRTQAQTGKHGATRRDFGDANLNLETLSRNNKSRDSMPDSARVIRLYPHLPPNA